CRRGAAGHLFHASRARDSAQRQRLGRSVAEHLAVDRIYGRRHDVRGDLLSPHAGLTVKRLLVCIASTFIAACAVDPVRPPDVPKAERYTSTPVSERMEGADIHGGNAQLLAVGKEVPAQWWTSFQSPALDELVGRALAASPTLSRARAKLRQSQE